MQVLTVDELGTAVGEIWRGCQNQNSNPEFFVAAPLSSTPLPIYNWIIANHTLFHRWENLRFVLMDEMVEGTAEPFSYINTDDLASYEGFALRHFIQPLTEQTKVEFPILKPSHLDTISNYEVPLDLLILALGVRGNYANVMPGTALTVGWHIAHLIPEFRQAHTQGESAPYAGASFREYGMSLGPQQVMAARRIVVCISGPKKYTLAETLLRNSEFDPDFPLSIIHHPSVRERVSLYLTKDVGLP